MPSPKEQGNGQEQNRKPKKHIKTYEFKIYTLASGYTNDLELLATVAHNFQDVFVDGGRPVSIAKNCAEEYARNIGLFGVPIENPKNQFNYYPPNRIAKVEYSEMEK